MVWRISLGDSLGEVAEMVGYSKKWTTEIVRRYESGGVEALGDRRHENPGTRERGLCSTRPERRSYFRPSVGLLRVAECGAERR
jgi:hypothetical protein